MMIPVPIDEQSACHNPPPPNHSQNIVMSHRSCDISSTNRQKTNEGDIADDSFVLAQRMRHVWDKALCCSCRVSQYQNGHKKENI